METINHSCLLNNTKAIKVTLKDADLKSYFLYDNLPVQTKMAILSSRLKLLPILLHEQFIHHKQINLR